MVFSLVILETRSGGSASPVAANRRYGRTENCRRLYWHVKSQIQAEKFSPLGWILL